MVSIIILTYNNLEITKQCIESILKNTNKTHYEIIVVDNGSTDKTSEYLQSFSSFQLILNKENYGFPKGCNQGYEIAKGNYICLLNNDTIVTENWLERLIYHLNNGFDIVGPCSNFVDGKQQVNLEIYNNETELNQIAENFYNKNQYKSESVNWIIGFCMLIKKEVIEKIGLFDEKFGLGNWEDIDFCTRVINNICSKYRFKIAIARDVFIHHFGTQTFKNMNYLKILKENQQIYIDKMGDRPKQ
jgi:GT2 family glycosyltransferase